MRGGIIAQQEFFSQRILPFLSLQREPPFSPPFRPTLHFPPTPPPPREVLQAARPSPRRLLVFSVSVPSAVGRGPRVRKRARSWTCADFLPFARLLYTAPLRRLSSPADRVQRKNSPLLSPTLRTPSFLPSFLHPLLEQVLTRCRVVYLSSSTCRVLFFFFFFFQARTRCATRVCLVKETLIPVPGKARENLCCVRDGATVERMER